MNNFTLRLITIFLIFTFLFASIPFAAGDGMPAIRFGEWEDPPEVVFSSIFESRQLATVELINDSHERISLFLSVYSLNPKENLTIIVPLRTLPVNISGEPIKETDFRERYKINRAEKEVVRQNPDKAYGRLGQQANEYFEFSFGSLVWTLPGEYTHENIRRARSYGTYDVMSEGGYTVSKTSEPQPIQHYEFDGFSIDIFGIDSGYVLSEYLEEKNLVLPDSESLEKYSNQYIAVIESKAKAPISEADFNILQSNAPNSIETLIEELKNKPDRKKYEISRLKADLHDEIYYEIDSNLTYFERNELYEYMDDLVDVVFGETDFEGEVIKIILPLDDGKIFFPLGTSAGWTNNVGDIDILFKVPEDISLSLPHSKSAFFDGAHWYLIQMENSNPDFDLESSIKSVEFGAEANKQLAGFVYDNYQLIGLLLVLAIIILIWFGIAYFQKVFWKREGEALKNPLLWVFLGISLIISIPGALLVFLIVKPIPLQKITKEIVPTTLLLFYPISILLFALVVVV